MFFLRCLLIILISILSTGDINGADAGRTIADCLPETLLSEIDPTAIKYADPLDLSSLPSESILGGFFDLINKFFRIRILTPAQRSHFIHAIELFTQLRLTSIPLLVKAFYYSISQNLNALASKRYTDFSLGYNPAFNIIRLIDFYSDHLPLRNHKPLLQHSKNIVPTLHLGLLSILEKAFYCNVFSILATEGTEKTPFIDDYRAILPRFPGVICAISMTSSMCSLHEANLPSLSDEQLEQIEETLRDSLPPELSAQLRLSINLKDDDTPNILLACFKASAAFYAHQSRLI